MPNAGYGDDFSARDVSRPENVVFISGVRGSGKSSLLQDEIIDVCPRVVGFDAHSEHGKGQLTLEQFVRIPPSRKLPERFYLPVSPGKLEDADAAATALTLFVSTCESKVRNSIIYIEEPEILQGSVIAQRKLAYLATQSRHWGCPLVYVAQRAKQVSPTVRSQFDCVVTFIQSNIDDRAELEKLFRARGEESDGYANADRIATLKRHEYVVWRLFDGE